MVAALRHATGAEPIVTGKPDPTMHRESVQRSGARHPVMVGDRLDTDVAGADALGWDSLLVLTGIASEADAAAATRRPRYVAPDTSALERDVPTFEPGRCPA
jgi:ribonucleotide monophosphatase NagD (HAD superfamily)